MTKNKIPWLFSDTFDPHYSSEEELADSPKEPALDSEPDTDYPYNKKEILY